MSGTIDDINNLILDNGYSKDKTSVSYLQVSNNNINLIPVGPLCNNDGPNIKTLKNVVQYWNMTDNVGEEIGDSAGSCIRNAAKIINKQTFEEMSKIYNDTSILKTPGLYVTIIPNPLYAKEDVNLFLNRDGVINNQLNDSITIQKSQAVELFGYFCPNVSGTWKITIPSFTAGQLFSKLWISDDNALYDYTNSNADICNDDGLSGIATEFTTITVAAGSMIPFRVHVITTSAYNGYEKIPFITAKLVTVSTPIVGITTPLPEVNNNTTDYNYFITLTQNGKPYYKQLMYLALLQVKDSKYKCLFMNTTPENIKTIQELKINPPLQYITTSIATPLNSIVKGTANATQNQTTNVNAPLGIALNIDKGTWGQAPYKYNEVTSTTTKQQTYNPEKTEVKDGKTIKYAAGYTTKDVTTTQSTPKTVDQMKDVTQIDRNQVNSGSSLNISPSQYTSLYTNPVDTRNTNPGLNNNYVEYSYRPDQTKYTDKNIFLDKTGKLMIQYSYDGTINIEPITLTKSLTQVWDPKSGKCPYVLCLESIDNGVRLSIKNGESTLGFLAILDSSKDPRIGNCQVNSQWLRNLQDTSGRYVTQLDANTPLIQNQNALITPDGKYKLTMNNNSILLVYCLRPYNGVDLNNNAWTQTEKSNNSNLKITVQKNTTTTTIVNYTHKVNVDNNTQMYYFYRIPTRGLDGRIFLREYSDVLNKQKLYNVPTKSNYVLEYSKTNPTAAFKTMPSTFLISTSDYNNTNYTMLNGTTSDACQNECKNNNTCDHAFFMQNINSVQNQGTCYVDKSNQNNPIYSNTNSDASKYSDGTLYKKQYSIVNSCVNEKAPDYKNKIQIDVPEIAVNNYEISFAPVANQPELTYYCGLDWYISNNTKANAIWSGDKKVVQIESFNNSSAFDESCVSGPCANDKITTLQPLTDYYNKTQDIISQTYNITKQDLDKYSELYTKLADEKYKFDGAKSIIPSIFVNSMDSTPEDTLMDGQITDMKHTLLVQNTMYTLSTITAVSLVIIGILLGRE